MPHVGRRSKYFKTHLFSEFRLRWTRKFDGIRRWLHQRIADHQRLLVDSARAHVGGQKKIAPIHDGIRSSTDRWPQQIEISHRQKRSGLRPATDGAYVFQRSPVARVLFQRKTQRPSRQGDQLFERFRHVVKKINCIKCAFCD